jgi:hypothetical protein
MVFLYCDEYVCLLWVSHNRIYLHYSVIVIYNWVWIHHSPLLLVQRTYQLLVMLDSPASTISHQFQATVHNTHTHGLRNTHCLVAHSLLHCDCPASTHCSLEPQFLFKKPQSDVTTRSRRIKFLPETATGFQNIPSFSRIQATSHSAQRPIDEGARSERAGLHAALRHLIAIYLHMHKVIKYFLNHCM